MTEAKTLFNNANNALEIAKSVVDASLSAIKRDCAKQNGRLDLGKLDEHQIISYELAFCYAELTAGKWLIEFANNVRKASKIEANILFEEQMSLLFVAESLNNVRMRLNSRPADYLIDVELLNKINSAPMVDFISGELTSKNLSELGATVLGMDGRLGDYLLEEEQTFMQDEFRKFANDVVSPLAEEIHRKDLLIPDTIVNPLVELGCFGLSVPERFGGLQPDDREDNMAMIVVTEELSKGSLGAAGSLITRPEIFSRALLKGGTAEQQNHWLPKVAMADPLCAIAITEPDYGSDVASMKLKATPTENGWLLNGAKSWCTYGGKAGVLLVLARSEPDASLGHKGLSMFIVEKPTFDGHEFDFKQDGGGQLIGKAIPTIGYRGMHSFDLFFENFFVPDSGLVGGKEGLGKGFYFTMAGFSGGRIQTAARATGLMQATFERAVSYSQERNVFGKPIGEYQLTQAKLAKMAALLTGSRQFTYAVGRLMDEGKGQMEASLVKLFTCKTAEWIAREALQIHGGMGYAEESPVSRYYLDARVLSIFEGAEETLALKVIARNLIESAS